MTERMWRNDLSTDVEAFGVLASETRLRILQAVAMYGHRNDGAVPYSTLKETVGIDDSGKFNYHLDELRERFVLEERGGYVLTARANRALDTLLSKRYHDVENDPQSVEGHCQVCGGGFEVGYHWNFYLGCASCELPHVYRQRVSPAVVEYRDLRDLMVEYERAWRHKLASALEGLCIECGSPTMIQFIRLVDTYDEKPLKELQVSGSCTGCLFNWVGTVGQFLLAHPTVRTYCDEHGIDLDRKPFWCHEWVMTDLTTVVRADDPWRIEKVANVDGCRITAVFDDEGSAEVITHVDLRPKKRRTSDRPVDPTHGQVDRAKS